MPEHASMLIKSAEKQGWDLVVIQAEWKGFGTKLIETYNYLKSHTEVERFVFADAFDVVVLGTEEEFEEKFPQEIDMIVSAERGLWPPILHPFKSRYASENNGYNYPNSGLYYSESWYFNYLFEKYPPFNEIDDQYWLNICHLLENRIEIDYSQKLFNSHSFISDGEYTYENNRVQIMGNQPIFIHFNGKTVDETFNERVKI